jgi:hypothetical protein
MLALALSSQVLGEKWQLTLIPIRYMQRCDDEVDARVRGSDLGCRGHQRLKPAGDFCANGSYKPVKEREKKSA